jgi:hypothetical protein
LSIYTPSSSKQPSFIARAHAAAVEADLRKADREDPHKNLIRQHRAELIGCTHVEGEAARQWHAANDPVPAPAGCGGGRVHPSRADALAEFIQSQGWPDDPTAPITPVPSLPETIETVTAEAKARVAATEKALAEYERTMRD